jgi:SAM-dependent methyltransferase
MSIPERATPEFDQIASSFEELRRDPIHDFFNTSTRFFYERKLLLIEAFFRSRRQSTASLSWLDVGCGRGDLLRLGAAGFGSVTGCDVSAEMIKGCRDLEVRQQSDASALPFPEEYADFVTAVCVYHHVAPAARGALTAEVHRILKPKGVFAIIEHNPWNPVTQITVRRSPIDTDAILLRSTEAVSLMRAASFRPIHQEYFLYLPEAVYYRTPWVESCFRKIPFGCQYAVFGEKPSSFVQR